MTDVAIVGAGVIGCAAARQLARSGADVTVLERDEPGRHASWAAAGMLGPQAEADRADPFLDLLLAARDRFPALAAELLEETGVDIRYRTDGTLMIAVTEADEASLLERFAWQSAAGLAVERLTPADALSLEPALNPALRAALRFPGDHQVDNRHFADALRRSAEAAGVEIRSGVEVRSISRAPSGLRLETSAGPLSAGHVVLAAGSWSGGIAGLPRNLPVEPVHGQLVSLAMRSPPLRHVVGSARGYVVPRADGRLIVGTTVEKIGFETSVTAGGLHRVTGIGLEIAPTAAAWPLTAQWSGLRPGTPDRLPILGTDPDLPALVYATGHYRNGILLAPVTGEIVAALVRGEGPAFDLRPYHPGRFG